MRHQKLWVSLFSFGLMACLTGSSQIAKADSSWIAMLVKPLVNEVMVPALEKGVDTWQARHNKKPSQASMYDLQVVTTPTATDTQTADADDWKLPEEPVH